MNTLLSQRARADPPALLRPVQLAWLAAAAFVVSAGYLGGAYAAGVLVGAPLWSFVADRVGRGRILIIGLVGYVASLLAV